VALEGVNRGIDFISIASLARLATYIALGNDVVQVDTKIWVEEVQRVLRMVGLDMRKSALLFHDTQILNDSIVS
jgi:dynein heavy chain